jgi:adenylate cyclase
MAPRVERRLAAILAADVVGYSRLVGADEAGTIARLKALRKEFIEPLVAEHHGRVVKLVGDGALVEFASAVDAVECAVAIQNGVGECQASEPEDRRIQFRIGINVGDIIVEDGDILGDGVNVASRLEGLAEPGGVCVARTVYNHVRNKLALAFEPMGQHRVKNIAEPVTVYRVNPDAAKPGSRRRPMWTQRRWQAAAAVLALLVALGAGGAWYGMAPRAPAPETTSVEGAAVATTGGKPALPLPDKPSIVVLPFTNLSGVAEQQPFADALTEDIITGLARFRELFVISSNSSSTYKGRAVDTKQVGGELGVRFALEGSVRRSGGRLRVTTQLIDTTTDEHLWAETYDRELTADNYFKMQDEITEQVIAALGGFHGKLYASAAGSAQRRNTDSLEAYDLYVLSIHLMNTEYSEASDRKMEQYYRRALEKDPDYALAYMGLGWVELRAYWGGWSPDPQASLQQALEYGLKALALDENQAKTHNLLGDVYASMGQLDRGIAEHAEGRALNPNDSDIKSESSVYLAYAGRVDEAIELLTDAMRLNPFYPDWYLWNSGIVHYSARKYDAAIDAVERIREPAADALLFLAASYGQLGRLTEAQATVKRVLALDPNATVAKFAAQQPYKNPDDLEHYKDGLRKAGLPEDGQIN